MTRKLFFVLFLSILVSPTFANSGIGPNYGDYEKVKDTDVFKVYVTAAGDGYLWANAELVSRKQKSLFCPPAKAEFGGELFNSILIKTIRERGSEIKNDTPIALILLEGLEESYPCR